VADPPGPTWDDLVGELALEPHGLAHQLLQARGAPSLSTRLTTFTELVSPSTNNLAKSLLLHQLSSGDPTHTLAIAQGQIATLCDLREVLELNLQGERCAMGSKCPTTSRAALTLQAGLPQAETRSCLTRTSSIGEANRFKLRRELRCAFPQHPPWLGSQATQAADALPKSPEWPSVPLGWILRAHGGNTSLPFLHRGAKTSGASRPGIASRGDDENAPRARTTHTQRFFILNKTRPGG
jgi:hypothetical protein